MHLYHTLAISPGVVFPDACEIFLWQFGEANVWVNLHGEKIVKAIHFGWHLDKMARCNWPVRGALLSLTLVNFWLKASEILWAGSVEIISTVSRT